MGPTKSIVAWSRGSSWRSIAERGRASRQNGERIRPPAWIADGEEQRPSRSGPVDEPGEGQQAATQCEQQRPRGEQTQDDEQRPAVQRRNTTGGRMLGTASVANGTGRRRRWLRAAATKPGKSLYDTPTIRFDIQPTMPATPYAAASRAPSSSPAPCRASTRPARPQKTTQPAPARA